MENINKKHMIIVGIVIIATLLTIFIHNKETKENIIRQIDESGAVEAFNAHAQEDIQEVISYTTLALEKEMIKDSVSSSEKIYSLDLTKPSGVSEEDLKKVTKGGLVGLEKDFIEAEEKYGVNSVFLMAVAAHESAWGTILFRENNMFGFGRSGFSSKSECIDVVAKALSENYLSEDGSLYNGKTVQGVNKRYASNQTWYQRISSQMHSLYEGMGII